eukprot:TRINITY_DN52826_c0_g1_i1.p1 TRINITY_DN52826_c0_g1~~TRINITY_DN52826_c0_g1_i1.p1  ORF type:complete len:646 (+),score=159.97 TRINITY_DN52826_c0_g1_i1:36-1940(+)
MALTRSAASASARLCQQLLAWQRPAHAGPRGLHGSLGTAMRRGSQLAAAPGCPQYGDPRLLPSMLGGDAAAFEEVAAGLRAECQRNAATRSSSDDGGAKVIEILAARVGKAAMRGDEAAFDRSVAQLRAVAQERASSGRPQRHAVVRPPEDDPLRRRTSHAEKAPADVPRPAELHSEVPQVPIQHERGAASTDVKPEDFVWSRYPFNDGEEGNARMLRSFEDEYAGILGRCGGDLAQNEVLRATLDLAAAYVKNYALDKADLLYSKVADECRSRGHPWDVKCLQDLAALRFKQNRQPECAELLEELARRSPPHATIQENLGTAYNSLGEASKALDCFQRAVELKGGVPEKEDLWNLGLARKNLGEVDIAVDLLEDALQRFLEDAPDFPVTIAKVRDSLAEAYLAAGNQDGALEQSAHAVDLYATHVGTKSPLYASAIDAHAKVLQAAGERHRAFDAVVQALEAQSHIDSIHPTPVYGLLDRAEKLAFVATSPAEGDDEDEFEDAPPRKRDKSIDLRRLAPGIDGALQSLAVRGLDGDGNAGILFQKAGQVLLDCARAAEEAAEGDRDLASGFKQANNYRLQAQELLLRGRDLIEATSASGEADLSELLGIMNLQLGLLDARLTATTSDDETEIA